VTAPANKTVEATALLTPVTLGTATATDLVDGSLTPTASDTGPFARGAHTITWTATDSHGNKGTATQTVTIVDTTPPSAPSGTSANSP
jgi:HYR domain